MAGLYIHIPFCARKCNYCNFYSIASKRFISGFEEYLGIELELQKGLLKGEEVNSIYFGGGTPSMFSASQLEFVLEQIFRHYRVPDTVEITLEANPGDVTRDYLRSIAALRINRLSLGIQSFDDETLRYLSRDHSAGDARKLLSLVQASAWENYSVDLIFGAPVMSDKKWKQQLEIVADAGVPHLSAYALTVEEKTALALFIRKGKMKAPLDERVARQFEILMDWAAKNGYEHYEISNLAKKGFRSLHNSSYWKREHYLGIGPSAHSFIGNRRFWNIANTQKYREALEQRQLLQESEVIDEVMAYNELVMTSIRTIEGVDIWGLPDSFRSYFLQVVSEFIQKKWIETDGRFYRLSRNGKLLADGITAALFYLE